MSDTRFTCTCRFNENGDTICTAHEPPAITYYNDRDAS